MTTKKRHLMINLKAAVGKWNGIVNFNGYEIWIYIYIHVCSPQSKLMKIKIKIILYFFKLKNKIKKKGKWYPTRRPSDLDVVGRLSINRRPKLLRFMNDMSMMSIFTLFMMIFFSIFYTSYSQIWYVFLFSSNICAWINNNANILYLWFKKF
jgi:hypothetical protein